MIKWLILLGLVLAVAGATFAILLVSYKTYKRHGKKINNEYDNYPNE